jgi:exodeoxyribonuclease VII small subunit
MAKAKPAEDYETLRAELDTIIVALQSDSGNVDESIKHYKRGLELVQKLEAYLKTAENDIRELKAKYDKQV